MFLFLCIRSVCVKLTDGLGGSIVAHSPLLATTDVVFRQDDLLCVYHVSDIQTYLSFALEPKVHYLIQAESCLVKMVLLLIKVGQYYSAIKLPGIVVGHPLNGFLEGSWLAGVERGIGSIEIQMVFKVPTKADRNCYF